jgi:phytoene synthase
MAQSFARGRLPLPKLPQTGWSPRSVGEPLDQAVAKRYIGQQARAACDAVRPQFRHGSPAQRAAMLPLALVEPYLRACEKQDHDLLRDIGDVAPLVRVWRIWRAHLTGRL